MKPIVCKPKLSAYFSVGFILLICYSWLIYLLNSTMQLEQASWWRYALMSMVAAVSTMLTIRLFSNFKVVTIKSNKLEIRWPLLFKQQELLLSNLQDFAIEQVKTPNGLYEQLLLRFPNKILKFGNQEYEQYERMKSHIQQLKQQSSHPKASKRKKK